MWRNLTLMFLLASVAVVVFAEDARADEPALVFLLGGQSNMEGVAPIAGLPSLYSTPNSDVRIWSHAASSYVNLMPGFGNGSIDSGDGTRFGPELAFGYEMAALNPGREIYLIKYAVGGTSLSDDWDPDGSDNPQYDEFMRRTAAALGGLNSSGIDYDLAGMLWMQGEEDAKFEVSGQGYAANLSDFIVDMRDNFGGDLKFVFGRLHDELPSRFPYASDVRSGQTGVAGADPQVAFVDTDSFGVLSDEVHFDQPGTLALGSVFAQEMDALLVPEPTSAMLLALGGVLVASRRRREN